MIDAGSGRPIDASSAVAPRWRHIATTSLALAALLFGGIVAMPAYQIVRAEWVRWNERPRPVLATPEETRAILAGVLELAAYQGKPPPPPRPGEPHRDRPRPALVLSDLSLCFDRNRLGDCADDLFPLDNELELIAPRKLREEMVIANRKARRLELEGIVGTRVVSQAQIESTLREDGWWHAFYARFPQTAGVVRISHPVLARERSHALVVVSHNCDGLCGSVTAFALDRTGSQWRVSNELRLSTR